MRSSNSRIRTLTDESKKPIEKPVEEILQDQYKNMWNQPLPDFLIEDSNLFFKQSTENEPNEILFTVRFNQEKVEKSLKKIEISATASPDGIPGILLNKLAEQLAEPLSIIYTKSMKLGNFIGRPNSPSLG